MTTAADKPAPPTGTLYIILGRYEDNAAEWRHLGGATAHSSDAAVRAWHAKHGHATVAPSAIPVELVAVPARSFKPVKVKTETVTRLTLEHT